MILTNDVEEIFHYLYTDSVALISFLCAELVSIFFSMDFLWCLRELEL